MKRFNKIYSVSSMLLVMLLTGNSSCKKLLDQTPRNSTYADVYWQSVRDCQSALAGNYALLRASLTDPSSYDNNAFKYYMYGDAETTGTSYFTMNYNGDGLEGIQGGDFTFQYNIQTLGDWTSFYKTIAMCNLILKKVPSIDDAKLEKDVEDVQEYKNKVMGQALFIRAYTYFMLTKVYGDVPMVTEVYDNVIAAPQLPRADKKVVMKQIEDDCHQAIGMLAWGYETNGERAVTANRGSVYALLAHLYLWRATMSDLSTDTPDATDVNSADTTLKTLITKGGYTLQDTASYGNQFIGLSTESIFELGMSENNQEGAYYHIGLDFLTGKYISGYGSSPRCWVPSGYLNTHYGVDLEGDGEGWVNFPAGGWQWVPVHVKGIRYYYNGTDVTSMADLHDGYAYVYHADIDDYKLELVGGHGLDPNDVRLKNNFDGGGSQGLVCRKYSNIVYRNPSNKTSGYMSNNMILFRLSDMMLLQAEVALYKDDLGTAVTVINNSRKRYGSRAVPVQVADGKASLMYQYMLERGKELYLEGHVYWDLMRTRQYRQFISWLSDGRFQQGGFYWPVYPYLMKDNRFLTQTLYWRGKV